MNNISPNQYEDHSLWEATKKRLKRPHVPIPPICKNTGSWVLSDEEKVETLREHFVAISKPHESPRTLEGDAEIFECLESPSSLNLPITPCT